MAKYLKEMEMFNGLNELVNNGWNLEYYKKDELFYINLSKQLAADDFYEEEFSGKTPLDVFDNMKKGLAEDDI